VEVWLHAFFTSAQGEGELSASRLDRFTPGERVRGIRWIGGWVDLRTGLDAMAKTKNPSGNLTSVVQAVA
jgi:hypothetical protein